MGLYVEDAVAFCTVCLFNQKVLICLLAVGDTQKENGNAEIIYLNFPSFKL